MPVITQQLFQLVDWDNSLSKRGAKLGWYSRSSCLSCHSSEQMSNTCQNRHTERITVTDHTARRKQNKAITLMSVTVKDLVHSHLVWSASLVRYSSICGNTTPSIVTRSMLWWRAILSMFSRGKEELHSAHKYHRGQRRGSHRVKGECRVYKS